MRAVRRCLLVDWWRSRDTWSQSEPCSVIANSSAPATRTGTVSSSSSRDQQRRHTHTQRRRTSAKLSTTTSARSGRSRNQKKPALTRVQRPTPAMLFVTCDLDLWPFDPKINGFQDASWNILFIPAASVFEISSGKQSNFHKIPITRLLLAWVEGVDSKCGLDNKGRIRSDVQWIVLYFTLFRTTLIACEHSISVREYLFYVFFRFQKHDFLRF